MRWSQATEVGLIRKQNEDSVCVVPELSFFAVADGMGGHLAGEVASRMAIEAIAAQLTGDGREEPDRKLLLGAHQANSNIYEASRKDNSCRGMGTTLTAGVIRKGELILAHVGDSRAYLIRKDSISPLTEDHSLVQEMIRQGGITREQARDHPHRNVLTRALGTDASVNVDLVRVELMTGDVLLFCSDGLSGLVDDDLMLRLVRSSSGPDEAVKKLVAEALRRGGSDNISVIVVATDE